MVDAGLLRRIGSDYAQHRRLADRVVRHSVWLDSVIAERYEAFIVPDGAKPDASVAVTLEPDRTEDQRRPYAVTRNGEDEKIAYLTCLEVMVGYMWIVGRQP